MKMKVSAVIGALLAVFLAMPVFAQSNLTTPASNAVSYDVGVFSAPAYIYSTPVFSGCATSGTCVVTLYSAAFVTTDGRRFAPFGNATLPPVTIGSAGNIETVTPSSAVGCSTVNTNAANQGVCTLTMTTSFAHGRGDIVTSGDYGIQEAINDAGNNGGGAVYWFIPSSPSAFVNSAIITPSPVTLATGAAGTAFNVAKIPTRSTIQGSSARVTTTITGCSGGWSLGYTTGTELSAANTTLTAGTTTDSSTMVPNLTFNAAAIVPEFFCTTSNATAGAIRGSVWGYKLVAPTF